MSHEPIKTAEERIHPLALDDKSVWCNEYFDEVAELRAQNEALKQENENQAAEIERLTECLVGANSDFELYERKYYLELNKVEDLQEEKEALCKLVEELGHRAPTTVGLGQAPSTKED